MFSAPVENPGSMTTPDVRSAAGGDREAFRRLVSQNKNLVTSIALATVGDVSTSEERVLREGIELLPDDSREVVILFYREGKSVSQVAGLLDLSEDAVKKRLSRARETLRETVLESMGETARGTAPREALCAAIVASLPAGGPVAGTGLATKLAKGGVFTKAGGLLVGSLGGGFLGMLGVEAGHRMALRLARDDQERRSLAKLRNWGLAITFSCLSAGWAFSALHHEGLALGAMVVFMGTLLPLYGVVGSRIRRRRQAAELLDDPGAARKHRFENLAFWGGMTVGALGGGFGVIWQAVHLLVL
jgi:hypothetical protein